MQIDSWCVFNQLFSVGVELIMPIIVQTGENLGLKEKEHYELMFWQNM